MRALLLALLLAQDPVTSPGPETPPAMPPPQLQEGPPPTQPAGTVPCTENPAESCVPVQMVIDGAGRAFTAADFGGTPLDMLSEAAVCTGRVTRGTFRYFYNGTAPSALVGILVPYPAQARDEQGQIVPPLDPEHTLEESGTVVRLYNRGHIVGFKAVWADWGGAEIAWECQP
jgi:hypothetical protein